MSYPFFDSVSHSFEYFIQKLSRFIPQSIVKKFTALLFFSVVGIAVLNIVAFWLFYNSYLRLYLSDKIQSRESVTIEYINNLIEKQTLEDIDSIFNDVEFEFFELLDIWNGQITLDNEKNVNIVVDFLVKSGVSPKYIEQIIPENNLEKILELLKDSESPESKFLKRLFSSLIISNIFFLALFFLVFSYFSKVIISPIQHTTEEIQKLKIWSSQSKIIYPRKDEIWLLIDAINGLNKRLSVQEMIRNRLLADISHELKTPITSIQCYLEWIADGVIELNPQNLSSITEEMKRLIELVNRIMEYEKFENTDLKLKKVSLSPRLFLEQLIAPMKISLEEKWQQIEIHGSKNIEIFVDSDLFTQLCYNIIGNFQKYAGDNTILSISISAKSIKFTDNGKGISKKELPLVFEKFYQGKEEKTGNIKTRGIGVWLSVVKKIIESHNWEYHTHSDTGKGFSLEIVMYTSSPNFHTKY